MYLVNIRLTYQIVKQLSTNNYKSEDEATLHKLFIKICFHNRMKVEFLLRLFPTTCCFLQVSNSFHSPVRDGRRVAGKI